MQFFLKSCLKQAPNLYINTSAEGAYHLDSECRQVGRLDKAILLLQAGLLAIVGRSLFAIRA